MSITNRLSQDPSMQIIIPSFQPTGNCAIGRRPRYRLQLWAWPGRYTSRPSFAHVDPIKSL